MPDVLEQPEVQGPDLIPLDTLREDPRYQSADEDTRRDIFSRWAVDTRNQMDQFGLWTPENLMEFEIESRKERQRNLGIEPDADEEIFKQVQEEMATDSGERQARAQHVFEMLDEVQKAEREQRKIDRERIWTIGGDDWFDYQVDEQGKVIEGATREAGGQRKIEDARRGLEALQGKRPTAVVEGVLLIDPDLYLNRSDFVEAVNNSGADPDEKARVMASFDPTQEAITEDAWQAHRGLLSFRHFAEDYTKENPDASEADVLDAFKKADAGAWERRTFSFLDGLVAKGFGSFLSGTAAGIGYLTGSETLQEAGVDIALASGEMSESFQQDIETLGGATTFDKYVGVGGQLLGQIATTMASGGLGPTVFRAAGTKVAANAAKKKALQTAMQRRLGNGRLAKEALKEFKSRKLSIDEFTNFMNRVNLGVTAGMQSAAPKFYESYTRNWDKFAAQGLAGEELEEKARSQAYLDSLRTGFITGTVTSLFGFRGVEAIAKVAGSPVAREKLATNVKESITGILKASGNEALEEAIDEGLNTGLDALLHNPDMTFDDWVDTVLFAGSAGAIFGGAVEGPMIIADVVTRNAKEVVNNSPQMKARRDAVAQLRAQGMDEAADAMEQNNLQAEQQAIADVATEFEEQTVQQIEQLNELDDQIEALQGNAELTAEQATELETLRAQRASLASELNTLEESGSPDPVALANQARAILVSEHNMDPVEAGNRIKTALDSGLDTTTVSPEALATVARQQPLAPPSDAEADTTPSIETDEGVVIERGRGAPRGKRQEKDVTVKLGDKTVSFQRGSEGSTTFRAAVGQPVTVDGESGDISIDDDGTVLLAREGAPPIILGRDADATLDSTEFNVSFDEDLQRDQAQAESIRGSMEGKLGRPISRPKPRNVVVRNDGVVVTNAGAVQGESDFVEAGFTDDGEFFVKLRDRENGSEFDLFGDDAIDAGLQLRVLNSKDAASLIWQQEADRAILDEVEARGPEAQDTDRVLSRYAKGMPVTTGLLTAEASDSQGVTQQDVDTALDEVEKTLNAIRSDANLTPETKRQLEEVFDDIVNDLAVLDSGTAQESASRPSVEDGGTDGGGAEASADESGSGTELNPETDGRSTTDSGPSERRGGGLRSAPLSQTGVDFVEQSARNYSAENAEALDLETRQPEGRATVSVGRSRRVADLYDQLPEDDSANPEVREAYEALGREIEEQYRIMTEVDGIEVTYMEDDPYPSSVAMMEDVRDNKRMRVFKGGEPHPFLGPESADANGITLNEKFRAVHDYYGHAAEGNSFGPIGEERAWVAHARMFSPLARRAMTTETRGQNSWVNYNPTMWNDAGWRGSKNNPEFRPPQDRPFAVQKVALMPEWASSMDSVVTRDSNGDLVPAFPPTEITEREALQRMLDEIKANPDGFTLSLGEGEPAVSGYVVAPEKTTETVLTVDELTVDKLEGFLAQHSDLFALPGAHIGGWHDAETGRFVLDVSFPVESVHDAVRLGVLGDQDAIWDVENEAEIRLKDEDGNPTTPEGHADPNKILESRDETRSNAQSASEAFQRGRQDVREEGDQESGEESPSQRVNRFAQRNTQLKNEAKEANSYGKQGIPNKFFTAEPTAELVDELNDWIGAKEEALFNYSENPSVDPNVEQHRQDEIDLAIDLESTIGPLVEETAPEAETTPPVEETPPAATEATSEPAEATLTEADQGRLDSINEALSDANPDSMQSQWLSTAKGIFEETAATGREPKPGELNRARRIAQSWLNIPFDEDVALDYRGSAGTSTQSSLAFEQDVDQSGEWTNAVERLVDQLIEANPQVNVRIDRALSVPARSIGDRILINPGMLAEQTAGLYPADAHAVIEKIFTHENIHQGAVNSIGSGEVLAIASDMTPAGRSDVARRYLDPAQYDTEADYLEAVARFDGSHPDLSPAERQQALYRLGHEHLRMVYEQATTGQTTEELIAFAQTEPGVLARIINYLRAALKQLTTQWRIRRDPALHSAMDRLDKTLWQMQRGETFVHPGEAPFNPDQFGEPGEGPTRFNSVLGRQVPLDKSGGVISEAGEITTSGTPDSMNMDFIQRRANSPKASKTLRQFFVKQVRLTAEAPGMRDLGKKIKSDDDLENANKVYRQIQTRLRKNLLTLMEAVPPNLRDRWRQWYWIAHDWASDQAGRAGRHRDAVAAMIARLSPGTDWYQNLTMVDHMIRVLNIDPVLTEAHVQHAIDRKVSSTVNQLTKAERTPEAVAKIEETVNAEMRGETANHIGKRLSIIPTGKASALLIRSYSEMNLGNLVFDHNGEIINKADGTPAGLSWQSYENIWLTLDIYRDPTPSNVSKKLGGAHKIRSFYNNIIAPDSAYQHVTVDTHAVGAALLLPVSQQEPNVKNALGAKPKSSSAKDNLHIKGTYPMYVKAYRDVAVMLGYHPREVQSITWEAIRHFYPQGFKKEPNLGDVGKVYDRLDRGTISRTAAVNKINELVTTWHQNNPKAERVILRPLNYHSGPSTLSPTNRPPISAIQEPLTRSTGKTPSRGSGEPQSPTRTQGPLSETALDASPWGRKQRIPLYQGNSGGYKAGGVFTANFKWDKRLFERLMKARSREAAAINEAEFFTKDIQRKVKAHRKNGVNVDMETINTALGNTDNRLTQNQQNRISQIKRDGLRAARAAYVTERARAAQLDNQALTTPNPTALQNEAAKVREDAKDAFDAAVEGYKQAARSYENQARADNRRRARRAVRDAQNSLPDDIRQDVRRMRVKIDLMGRELRRSGMLSDDIRATISENRGLWLHRSYRIFDQDNYVDWLLSEDPEAATVRNNALRYVRSELIAEDIARLRAQGETLANAKNQAIANATDDAIRERFHDYLSVADEGAKNIFQGASLSKPTEILLKRGTIPPAIRALWGEYNDPTVNAAKSLGSITQFVETQKFFEEVKRIGEAEGWLSTGKYDRDGNRLVPLFDNNMVGRFNNVPNPRFSPLAGLNGPPMLRDAFQHTAGYEQQWGWVRFLNQLTGYSMMTKTALSWQATVRNNLGNVLFIVANGNLSWRTPKRMATAFMTTYGNLAKRGGPELRAKINRMVQLGMIGDSNVENLIRELTDGLSSDKKAVSFMEKLAHRTFFSKVVGGTKDKSSRFYGAQDDLWKVVAFESEVAKVRKFREGQGRTDEQIEEEAADIVRSTMPTYSRAPEAVRMLRRIPFMAPFVTFSTEVYRTTGGLLRTGLSHTTEGLRTNNPAMVRAGVGRLFGFGMATAGLYGLVAMMRNLGGFNDEDEENLRQHVPYWEENSSLVLLPTGKEGEVDYFNLSYLNPYDVWARPVRAFMRGVTNPESGVADTAKATLSELFDPVAKEQILFGSVIDSMRGVTSSGRNVYDRTDSTNKKVWLSLKHITESALVPGTVTSIDRIRKGWQGHVSPSGRARDFSNEFYSAAFGIKISSVNTDSTLNFAARQFNFDRRDAAATFTRHFKSPGTQSDADILNSYVEANEKLKSAYADLRRKLVSAIELGHTDPETALQILQSSKVGNSAIEQILANRYVRYEPSSQSLELAQINGRELGQDRLALLREAMTRVPAVQDLTEGDDEL